ncbi:MAG: FAD-dependent oxidoreductase [Nitrospirae bacterium]|nr:FAD-dependent oxidoreductase [Nitrospirota bacterium]
MNNFDIVIVGAGISGLSLAHYCARAGFKTLVLEKSDRAGGTFHSQRFEGTDGFWIELGAHTCYNSYGNLIKILEESGAISRIIQREKVSFRMLAGNRITSIPSQLDFVELLLSAPKLFTLKKEGQSISSYYSRIVGSKNYEKVLSPSLCAVICQAADDFPSAMLFQKRPRRKDIIRKFSLDNGIQTITDSIVSQKDITVMTGKETRDIRFDKGVFVIMTADGTIYESRNLAMAIPPSAAARLLSASFHDVSVYLSQIREAQVESVGVAVKKEMLRINPCAGLVPIKDNFFSVVSRDIVHHDTYRGFTFHFKPGVMDHDVRLKRISEVLGIQREDITHVASRENVVPSLRAGHEKLTGMIDSVIAGKRLLLTGNYFDGMAIEDCVSRSLKEFSRLKAL